MKRDLDRRYSRLRPGQGYHSMKGFQIVVDAQAPSELAQFWAEALPSYNVRPYDAKEIARLASIGLTPDTDPSVPIEGDGPTIWFQKSRSTTTQRNRIHFDVSFGPRGAEVERFKQLGALVREQHDDHTVMLDPEGNQFCVFDS